MRRLFLLIILLAANLFAGAAPPTVLDIAALKALIPGQYPTVQVLRYSTDTSFGYAGGGLVNWVAGSTKAAAACSVYVPNSNPAVGRWERPRSPFRLASQCGIMTLDDTISGEITYPALAGSGTRMVVASSTGKTSTQSIPSGGSLANPTATIGLTPVNGSLTSGMRSDGAPALSQAITPVWTGQHQWSALGAFGAGINFSGNATPAAATIGRTAADGLFYRGIAGSSYDLALMESGGSYLLRNPAGGTALEFPGSGVNMAFLAGSGTRMVVADATGEISTQSIPAGGSLANPTATIGLTAVNGSATSGMRSDGAPALSQAIAPTWTGQHQFNTAPITAGIRSSITASLVRTVANDSLRISGSNSTDSGMNITLTGDDAANNSSFTLKSHNTTVMQYTPSGGMNLYGGWASNGDFRVVPNATLEAEYRLLTEGTAIYEHGRTSATPYSVSSSSNAIAIDAAYSDFYTVTIAENTTLANPTNSSTGRHFTIRVKQHTVGGPYTMDYGNKYRFPNGVPPVLSTAGAAVDYLSFVYDEAADKWDFIGNALNLLPAGS